MTDKKRLNIGALAMWAGAASGGYGELPSPPHIPEGEVQRSQDRKKRENRLMFKELRGFYNAYRECHGLTTNQMAKLLQVSRAHLKDVLTDSKLHDHVIKAIDNLRIS